MIPATHKPDSCSSRLCLRGKGVEAPPDPIPVPEALTPDQMGPITVDHSLNQDREGIATLFKIPSYSNSELRSWLTES
jgi:hypothetical protein